MDTARLAFLLREGPAVVFVCKAEDDWRPTYISDNIEEHTGHAPEAFLSDPQFWLNHIHPEDRPRIERAFSLLQKLGQITHEYRFRCADGTYLWTKCTSKLIHGSDGSPTEVIGYWTDITEIRRLTDQLEDELARTQAMLMAIPDALFELSPEGRYMFFQAEPGIVYEEMDHIIGRTVHDLLPKEIADLCLNAITRALDTGDPQVIRYSLSSSEGARYYQTSLGPDPTHKTVVALVRDITDEVTHRQELEAQKKHLEDANESLEQFVYVASHDLREPLIGVAGYATLVQRRYQDRLDDQGRHFLDEVIQGCRSMEAKIDDLLALSRAGRMVRFDPFPLGAAVEEARRSVASSILRTQAIILYPEQLPVVRGERGYIAQVFQNLFSNSIKYRRKDQTPVIEISVTKDPKNPTKCVVAVKDNGIGFDMQHADRIFGVFQRLYTPEQYPGTGIGLAIVKKIIDKHEGRIWALSDPQVGSTFFFTLPTGKDA